MPATRTGAAHRGWPLEKRFKAHINMHDDECWEWTSVIDDKGRGRFKLGYRMVKAHLAAKFIFHNEVQESGLEAHHTCLHGWCANPDHIVFLTKAEHKREHTRLRRLAVEV